MFSAQTDKHLDITPQQMHLHMQLFTHILQIQQHSVSPGLVPLGMVEPDPM